MRFSGGELREAEAPTDAAAETDRKAPAINQKQKYYIITVHWESVRWIF